MTIRFTKPPGELGYVIVEGSLGHVVGRIVEVGYPGPRIWEARADGTLIARARTLAKAKAQVLAHFKIEEVSK